MVANVIRELKSVSGLKIFFQKLATGLLFEKWPSQNHKSRAE